MTSSDDVIGTLLRSIVLEDGIEATFARGIMLAIIFVIGRILFLIIKLFASASEH
jgi:hypothetical protein